VVEHFRVFDHVGFFCSWRPLSSPAAEGAVFVSGRKSIVLAIGLVETKGLIGLVAASDAMAKAANVQIVKRIDRWR
jgi:hypothetical protein